MDADFNQPFANWVQSPEIQRQLMVNALRNNGEDAPAANSNVEEKGDLQLPRISDYNNPTAEYRAYSQGPAAYDDDQATYNRITDERRQALLNAMGVDYTSRNLDPNVKFDDSQTFENAVRRNLGTEPTLDKLQLFTGHANQPGGLETSQTPPEGGVLHRMHPYHGVRPWDRSQT